MGVMTDLHAESLPCGADVAALVEQVGDGRAGERSAHQATCPYCQTALEELGRLWAPVDRFARASVRVPAGFAVAVLGRVRELVGGGGQVLLGVGRGVTRVSMWALGRMAALAAAGVPGVRAVLGRVVNAREEPRSGRPPSAPRFGSPKRRASLRSATFAAQAGASSITCSSRRRTLGTAGF